MAQVEECLKSKFKYVSSNSPPEWAKTMFSDLIQVNKLTQHIRNDNDKNIYN
jgi:hypothetical protein